MKNSKWIVSFPFDLIFFSGPGVFALLYFFLFSDSIQLHSKINPLTWAVLVLFFDVGHVYSTLYRTYWNQEEFSKNRSLYLVTPFLCYIAGVLLYSLGKVVFWRIAAYLAVFHFIRQQFGFMAIYRKKNNSVSPDVSFNIDKYAIYIFTLVPVAYWHLTETKREFSWFVENDFFYFKNQRIAEYLLWFFLIYCIFWVLYHIVFAVKRKFFNTGKFIFVFSTALVWYFGIVYFNSDIVFTATNVLAHGIPYIALIWMYLVKSGDSEIIFFNWLKSKKLIQFIIFIFSIFLLAYFEEFFWDIFIWKDHPTIFGSWKQIPSIEIEIQTFLIPFLFLPQVTHYVLDGFIWKIGDRGEKLDLVLGLKEVKNL